jgi:hypothetical protein
VPYDEDEEEYSDGASSLRYPDSLSSVQNKDFSINFKATPKQINAAR